MLQPQFEDKTSLLGFFFVVVVFFLFHFILICFILTTQQKGIGLGPLAFAAFIFPFKNKTQAGSTL